MTNKIPLQFLVVLLTSLGSLYAAPLQAANRINLVFDDNRNTREVRLSIGMSQIIQSTNPLEQVVIGSPAIADIKLLSARQVLILGKKPGTTNLVFRDKRSSLIEVMDVVVSYDLEGLKRKLNDTLPDEKEVEVRGSSDSVMLSGTVSSVLAMDMALAVASSFVPKEKVINLLQVGGGQQVMLKARISEIARNSLKNLGVQTSISDGANDETTYSLFTGYTLGNAFFDLGITDTSSSLDFLSVRLAALEKQGLAKTLAEPNLVALSGQEASFLAGGEFPIPIAQDNDSITVSFKEFGVGLKFTPTVMRHDKINIKMTSEVSALDLASSVTTGGISVPGVTTRRTATTIEMADGQSFAIAGLLQSEMNSVINQVPGLGDIPILGALFRSSEFQRQETELVIVVTPRLVKPVLEKDINMPTDIFVPPSGWDQYLMGSLEGSPKDREEDDEKQQQEADGQNGQGGIDGEFGHQM